MSFVLHFRKMEKKGLYSEAISDANDIYQNFEQSVGLVEEAKKHSEFLKTVDKVSKQLHQYHVIHNAVRRYETIWLPIVAENPNEFLEPPLDVHWVWHVHMLCPKRYVSDCQELLGCIPNHRFYGNEQKAQILWAQSTQEPFEVSYEDIPVETEFSSRLSYDIVTASNRQKEFYYNVSLPHFKVTSFLQSSLSRYKRFIALKRCTTGAFLVPTYDIDLMWHTHQLCPLEYTNDLNGFLGYVMEHDDSTTDRNPGSKLSDSTAETSRLWSQAYPWEQYYVNGAMYRGMNPRGHLYTMTKEEEDEAFRTSYLVQVQSVALSGNLKAKYKVQGTIAFGYNSPRTTYLTMKKGLPIAWYTKQPNELLSFHLNAKTPSGVVDVTLYRRDGFWGSLNKQLFQKLYVNVSKGTLND